MKAIITLAHTDEVSGTTIFDDGTKAYWTEGRSSAVAIITHNGEFAWLTNGCIDDEMHEVMQVLSGDQYGFVRTMTVGEEIEHNLVRNFGKQVLR